MDNLIKDYIYRKSQFMASNSEIDLCDRLILGLPMDATTSFRPGTRLGPGRIREVSEGIEKYSPYLDKSLDEINFYDAGDVIVPWGNVPVSLERMQAVADFYLRAKKKLFCLGGEHLVSLPIIKAYHDHYPDLMVVQLDAHADLRPDYLDEPLSHACVMRRIVELIGNKRLIQLGIRSATREEMLYSMKHTHMFFNEIIFGQHLTDLVDNKPVYITVDIDILDPAFAPGTGTPEAGGFSSRELIALIHRLSEFNVVGFDLVEVSPPYEIGDNTSILGAKILREALLAF